MKNNLCEEIGNLWFVFSGGVLVLVGLGPSVYGTVPIVTAGRREIDVKGIFRYANCYPMAIHLVSSFIRRFLGSILDHNA